MTDYGEYHDDIWDLVEFRDGIVDIKIKYEENTQIYSKLGNAQNNVQDAINILVKKAESEQEVIYQKLCPACGGILQNYRLESNDGISEKHLTADCIKCKKYMKVQPYWVNRMPLMKINLNEQPKTEVV